MIEFLRQCIYEASCVNEAEILLPETHWKKLYRMLDNIDTVEAEFLVEQMDLYKSSRSIPLHLAQHIYEVIS